MTYVCGPSLLRIDAWTRPRVLVLPGSTVTAGRAVATQGAGQETRRSTGTETPGEGEWRHTSRVLAFDASKLRVKTREIRFYLRPKIDENGR